MSTCAGCGKRNVANVDRCARCKSVLAHNDVGSIVQELEQIPVVSDAAAPKADRRSRGRAAGQRVLAASERGPDEKALGESATGSRRGSRKVVVASDAEESRTIGRAEGIARAMSEGAEESAVPAERRRAPSPSVGHEGGSRSGSPRTDATAAAGKGGSGGAVRLSSKFSKIISGLRQGATASPLASPTMQGKLHRVVAKWSYDGGEGELTFRRGDVIGVLEAVGPDWWLGELGDQRGYFPVNR